MKFLIGAALGLGALLLLLLTTATANTALLSEHYPLLLGLNAAMAVALILLVFYQLYRLWREHRKRIFGSRLKLRLMLMFMLMAVVPGALVYAVAVQFAMKSIESWFDVRVDKALEAGLTLGRNALDSMLQDLTDKARSMALELGDAPVAAAPTLLDRLREQRGIRSALLLSDTGRVLVTSEAESTSLLPDPPSAAMVRRARQSKGVAEIEEDPAQGMRLRVLVPVVGGSLGAGTRVLQLAQPVPQQLARSAGAVQAVYRDYQELSLARVGLKRLFGLTLTLTLLLALFAAIAVAFLFSRRLSAPLSLLAEGTQAVAQGDFSPREAIATRDELGMLTQSFSNMTRQLDDARAQAERSRTEVAASNAYLQSVLANLSAGVMAFDSRMRLRAYNRGAEKILGDPFSGLGTAELSRWPRLHELAEAITAGFAGARGEGFERQIEIQGNNGTAQVLLVRGSRLPGSTGGYVVVFDDVTQLIAAQRTAAWGEVARRLAHEIKNPLTPIQLSAERLQHKLADKLTAADRDMLDRSTRTIINQVEALKGMVNEFRDYAQLPAPQLVPLDINALVTEVLALYESARIRFNPRMGADLPAVLADANQLRQILHNLLRNAQDAASEVEHPQAVLETSVVGGMVRVVVQDNGPGFSPAILARAFDPYVTSKVRGTGLGLAIVKKIVDEHHGKIEIGNAAAGGARVAIDLPLAASGASGANPESENGTHTGG